MDDILKKSYIELWDVDAKITLSFLVSRTLAQGVLFYRFLNQMKENGIFVAIMSFQLVKYLLNTAMTLHEFNGFPAENLHATSPQRRKFVSLAGFIETSMVWI